MWKSAFLLFLVAPQQAPARFVALDVYVDSGEKPLAAWQFELACGAKIVALEGAAGTPPYYDPAALQGGRIVVASFTTEPNPPRGRVLVARLHMQETGSVEYAPRLVVAGAPGGARIDARIEIVRNGGKR